MQAYNLLTDLSRNTPCNDYSDYCENHDNARTTGYISTTEILNIRKKYFIGSNPSKPARKFAQFSNGNLSTILFVFL